MNEQTKKMPENLTPYGISTTHFKNTFTMKNRLWLKELGYAGLSNTLQGFQDSLDKAVREMVLDNRESRLGKTQILAKMSKTMKKQMESLTSAQLNLAEKQINTLSEIGNRMPSDTSANREVREIIRSKDISNTRILEMAKEDTAITCALLSSPHIKLAYGFNDKQIDELETINFKNNLGEEDLKILEDAIKTHDVLTDTRKTMNAKFDQCISIAENESYGSSSAIVAAAS